MLTMELKVLTYLAQAQARNTTVNGKTLWKIVTKGMRNEYPGLPQNVIDQLAQDYLNNMVQQGALKK